MSEPTIEALLAKRGAWLKGVSGNPEEARQRASLTRFISENYRLFEEVRDRIFLNTESYLRHLEITPNSTSDQGHELVADMIRLGLVIREEHGHEICEAKGKRYLSGGWLEELAYLAAVDAGADEAIFGQVLGWSVQGYTGENEIDLIVREGERLGFVSCKALRSQLDINDRKHRSRLMDAVHEADNLADHFGRNDECVAVLVSTDLYDETRNAPRYNALMGKAAVLNVKIIPLEEMGYESLKVALRALWEPQARMREVHESNPV